MLLLHVGIFIKHMKLVLKADKRFKNKNNKNKKKRKLLLYLQSSGPLKQSLISDKSSNLLECSRGEVLVVVGLLQVSRPPPPTPNPTPPTPPPLLPSPPLSGVESGVEDEEIVLLLLTTVVD